VSTPVIQEEPVNDPRTEEVLDAVREERHRQERLRREGRFLYTCASEVMSDGAKCAVLGEEFGEVCRAMLEKQKLSNDAHNKDLRAELIQVAAVAVAWAESLTRNPRDDVRPRRDPQPFDEEP
jgi:hypothetical protein